MKNSGRIVFAAPPHPPASLIPCFVSFSLVKLRLLFSHQWLLVQLCVLHLWFTDTLSMQCDMLLVPSMRRPHLDTHGHTHSSPSSPGLCRVWYSPRTYCCLWWWIRSPVPATSPRRWSFACSGISSLGSLSCQPNLSPVAAWECISHWAN